MRLTRIAAALAAVILGGSALALAAPAQADTTYILQLVCPVSFRATTKAGDLVACTAGKDGAEAKVPAGTTVRLVAEGMIAGWSSNCTPLEGTTNACTIVMTAGKTVSDIAPPKPAATKSPASSTGVGGPSHF
jgi:hypothetical protein